MTASERWRTRIVAYAAACGLLLSGAVVWGSTAAAFNATTTNSANSLAAGAVSLSDDDSGSALFSITGLKPADTDTRCIVVTYTGNLASSVKLYLTASSYTGTLGTYLDVTIEQGSGGSYASCTGFTPSSTIYSGTLANFASTKTSFATGVGTFTPSSNGTTQVYRFTYTVQDNTSAQGLTAGVGFTWEADNT